MQIKKRLSNAINLVLLASASILIFIATYFFSSYQTDSAFPIAKNANWIVRIDAETLLRQEAYNVLLGQKDNVFLKQLQKILTEGGENKSTSKLNINLKEDFIFYQFTHANNQILAIAFKTTNNQAFNDNINEFLSKNQAGAAEGDNALIFLQSSNQKATKSQLNKVLLKILNQAPTLIKHKNPEKNEFLTVHLAKNNKRPTVSTLDLSFQFQKEQLILDGKTTFNSVESEALQFGLNHKGLFISSRVIPQALTDSVLHFIPKELNHFKEITAFALDFQGTFLEDPTDSLPNVFGFLPTPIMNMIVRTKNPCSVTDLWASFPEKIKQPHLTLDFGETIYTLKQLSANNYFIGIDPNSVITSSSNAVFKMEGKLINTINIQGSTFVTTFIENMRPIKAMNEFLSGITNLNITIAESKSHNHSITGTIQFKEGKHPVHELTKLIVSLKQVMN